MPKLLPFRDYNEHDVINIYALSGYTATTATIVDRGTLVKIASPGFMLDQASPTEFLGNPSDFAPTNVVSQRYGVYPKVTPAGAGEAILGMTLFDVRETDENGELLKFRPRKAAELEAVISGQAVPIVRKGIFSYSGICTGNALTGSITAGAKLYVGTSAILSSYAGPTTGYTQVATALGNTDTRGTTVIFLNVP